MRHIGVKYHTAGDIYKYDGTLIPRDEPLFLFRGRDQLVPKTLEFYLELRRAAGTPGLDILLQDLDQIKAWQKANPAKLKTPGS